MGWHNPPFSWNELERRMSGLSPVQEGATWNKKRPRYEAPELLPPDEPLVPYAELHAHSAYSFLDGASMPEHLVEEAARLRLHAIAITDHDGFYGAVRFAEAADALKLPTVYGAELSLGLRTPQNGIPDPEGDHLLVLARGQEGYHRLSGALTRAHLTGAQKGRPRYDLHDLAERAEGHWVVLTGCRKGAVRRALESAGPAAAAAELDQLVDLFGRDQVVVELTDSGQPLDSTRNDLLAELARASGLPIVATGNVHYARPERFRLAAALAAVRARSSLDGHEAWLPAGSGVHLRSGFEMSARFARYPGAVPYSVQLADQLAFRLRSMKPGLPRLDIPDGFDLMGWLRHEVWAGAARRYPGLPESHRRRLESELAVIEAKDFPGYFLLVKDIVDFARERGILCQGRGSAASSAVCYVLGITAVDAIFYDLPFERFLSSIRDEEPDIDVDFDSDRREEVIQYVYGKYGRENAAQVANVVSYTPRNAIRDMAKALGHGPGQQDAWSKLLQRGAPEQEDLDTIPAAVQLLTSELIGFPRHLGIHSGGMVMTDRPIGEVVPVEHARMTDRTVLQWDKNDCADMGLVKFDLLGLGMLSALQHSFDVIRSAFGRELDLDAIPKEEAATYDALCRADAIGIFQVESRAQMGLLPRLQPRAYYDLVVQIALIRPGPIQGGAVHPFVRRKLGEEFQYLHPDLEPILGKTFGVPVFQEQVLKVAVALGGLSAEEADLLRRAFGSKRGYERIGALRAKLEAGMAAKGMPPDDVAAVYAQIEAFANFGFAESHALSFALLVYASSWLKLHYPAAFLAGLLRAQPMGFYSSATLVADARRHGVEVRRPDIQRSGVFALLEPVAEGVMGGLPEGGLDRCLDRVQPPVPVFDPAAPDPGDQHRRDAASAVRLGLAGVRGIGETVATRIVTERDGPRGPFRSMEDLVRRVGLTTAQVESLASADAFAAFGLVTREALWRAGSAATDRAEFLAGSIVTVQPPLFADPSAFEQLSSDLWATGISVADHPMAHLRAPLDDRGVLPSAALRTAESGRRVEVAGLVTHRQRPGTASGMTFLNLEDEQGLVNVICSVGVWKRYHRVARDSPALLVRGILERSDQGVINLLADRFEPLDARVLHRSRDFR
jgi:error-prone DNA polymerase